ncbi:MAG: glycoside hydrolase family 99-like domain-containing protein [Victivallales bacterium]|nr:glycoside hydrolase family 99-like domain-containing protein [Victivallales bacterium]
MTTKGYVPEPKPMKGPIEVSAFYYPGTEQMAEWDQVEQVYPHIKPLLGWYDEGNPEVIDWQIKWAVEHGISSFCVDWYWNNGVQRLDHWVKGFYKARYRKYLKWFVMWANHNEPGAHSTQDQINVTQFWLDNYFKTPEYYTIDGKPAVVVYAQENLDRDFIAEAAAKGETLQKGEGVKRALELSDRMVKEAGLPGIYFIDMNLRRTVDQAAIDADKAAGYKAQVVYSFDRRAYSLAPDLRKPGDTEKRCSYEQVVETVPRWWKMTTIDPSFPFWPIIPTGWDDTPRSFQLAHVIYGRTPELFGKACKACRAFCEETGAKRVIVAPINEWQEGSYIEPNAEFGFGMLDALRDAFCDRPADGWPANVTPQELGLGPYDYPPMEHLAKTSWDFSRDMQGWYRNPYGTAYIKIVDGAMHFFRSNSNRFAVRTRVAPFDASRFKAFKVRMRVTQNPHGLFPAAGKEELALIWGTPELPIFSKEFVISDKPVCRLPVKIDGEWHEYVLPVAENPYWRGMVDELWFDPANLSMAYVDIASMELV